MSSNPSSLYSEKPPPPPVRFSSSSSSSSSTIMQSSRISDPRVQQQSQWYGTPNQSQSYHPQQHSYHQHYHHPMDMRPLPQEPPSSGGGFSAFGIGSSSNVSSVGKKFKKVKGLAGGKSKSRSPIPAVLQMRSRFKRVRTSPATSPASL